MDIERRVDQIRIGLTSDEGDMLASQWGHVRRQEFQVARRKLRNANQTAGLEGSQSSDRVWLEGDSETIGYLIRGFNRYMTHTHGPVASVLEIDPPHHPDSLVVRNARALSEIALNAIGQLQELQSESVEGEE